MKDLRLILLLIISLFSIPVFSQTPTPSPKETPIPDDDGEVIRIESRLITVPVAVLNAEGQPVLGLKKEDFSLNEEGKLQEIEQLSDAEKVPLEIALLIDVSKSVNPLFDFEILAAGKFLREVMKADDRASVFLIGEKGVLLQKGESALKTAETIKTIKPTTYQTAFYDGILLAADYLKKNSPVGSRKVILTLSDGEDNWSEATRDSEIKAYREIDANINTLTREKKREILFRHREQSRKKAQARVARALQDADAVFYSINPAGGSYQLNKISQYGQSTMQAFAEQTGGTAFLPIYQVTNLKEPLQNSYNSKRNIEALENIFKRLANELRSQYLLQYYSDGEFSDGKYVKLNVSLKNGQRLNLRSRQGYFFRKGD